MRSTSSVLLVVLEYNDGSMVKEVRKMNNMKKDIENQEVKGEIENQGFLGNLSSPLTREDAIHKWPAKAWATSRGTSELKSQI